MARPLRIEYRDAFYHVTARGNEQGTIYRDDKDKERFLAYLESAVVRYKAVIHAYCLMSNHYHLLISTPAGNLSQILRHINGAYTVYFNKRHKRVGHLFQGRYKAILVEADEYAGELSRYIHLNPVRAGLVDRPENYIWSSYLSYIDRRKASDWLKTDWLLRYFGKRLSDSVNAYREFVEARSGVAKESPLGAAVASSVLGSEEFIDDIRERYLSGRKKDRNLPALAALTRISPKDITGKVRLEFRDDPDLEKKVGIYLSHRFSGVTLKEIGQLFSISESAVSQASRRFETMLATDRRLRKRVGKLQKLLAC